MNCPIDNTQLAITERNGVEIDYCPQCRGVWLDRGELDKIIDKTDASYRPREQEHRTEPQQHRESDYRRDDHNYKHKKRESFLGDLFDF